jgi:hypothetical protein
MLTLLSMCGTKISQGMTKMKNVNVHPYLFLSETYEPMAKGTCPLPPFCKILKSDNGLE